MLQNLAGIGHAPTSDELRKDLCETIESAPKVTLARAATWRVHLGATLRYGMTTAGDAMLTHARRKVLYLLLS